MQGQSETDGTIHPHLVLFVVCLGSFLSPLGMAAVTVAIPDMARDLQADAVVISWLPTVFLLSNVALMLPFGKLADIHGRKRIYALGLATNACCSIGSLLSPTIEWILFFRFLQGAGSAMVFGTGMAIITSVFPPRERGLPLGLNTASVYIGLTIAPMLGGWVTETFGWRAVFLLPVPPIALLLIIIRIYLKGDWRKESPGEFDRVGTLIFAAWALTLVVGLTGLPNLLNVLILLLSLALLAIFIRHQSRTAEPLIRVQLFRENRMFSFSLASAAFMYAANYPLIFLLSLYLQYVRGLSPLESGQLLMLQALAMALLAPFAGKFSDRSEPRLITTMGCAGVAAGFMILSQLDFDTSTMHIGAALFCIGTGFGLFSAPNNNAIMSSVRQGEVGVAAATISLSRVSGNLIGISLINLLVQLMMGNTQITADQYPQLLTTIRYALSLASLFVLMAAIMSAFRGKVAPQSETDRP